MRAEPKPRHVVLCGLSGAGKSTVGPLLARRLGRPFVDVDRTVESDAGRTVREIFAQDGEPAFRARERAAAQRALAGPVPAVIALGGGALEDDATLREATAHLLVWLDVPLNVLIPRVGNDRPLLDGDTGARLAALAQKRLPRYRQARLTVDASRPPAAIVAEICAALDAPASSEVSA